MSLGGGGGDQRFGGGGGGGYPRAPPLYETLQIVFFLNGDISIFPLCYIVSHYFSTHIFLLNLADCVQHKLS